MKELSQETITKAIKQAAIILRMHGNIVGNRVCQDWSGVAKESPEFIFSEDELDKISYQYELYNSNLRDYEEGLHGMSDEMVASFAIARILDLIVSENKQTIESENMNTHKTYQEAKIANPNEDVCINGLGLFKSGNEEMGWFKCDAANHCMTVEQFLKNGYKFVVGDVCINKEYGVEVISKPSSWNAPSETDNLRYVLRAAALEKQPRMKEVYEKVTEESASVFDLKGDLESGALHSKNSHGIYTPYTCEGLMVRDFLEYGVYRKVEKPIEWWEDLRDYVDDVTNGNKLSTPEQEMLEVNAAMTRDQWCDFARILLEQEGE